MKLTAIKCYQHGNKNEGIISIKTMLNVAESLSQFLFCIEVSDIWNDTTSYILWKSFCGFSECCNQCWSGWEFPLLFSGLSLPEPEIAKISWLKTLSINLFAKEANSVAKIFH